MFKSFKQAGAALMGVAVLSIVIISPARAGDDEGMGDNYYAGLNCNQLWHERNSIFALHGYCFKSQRAIETFGKGCNPPYGEIPANLKEVVKEIKRIERQKGC